MRLAIARFFINLQRWFEPFDCEKESLGYTCRHQMHGNVPECGGWSKVRGYNHATN